MSLKVLGKRNLEVHVLLHSLLIQQAQRLIHTLRHHNGHGFAPNSGSSSCIHKHICEENSIFFLIISLDASIDPPNKQHRDPVRCCTLCTATVCFSFVLLALLLLPSLFHLDALSLIAGKVPSLEHSPHQPVDVSGVLHLLILLPSHPE